MPPSSAAAPAKKAAKKAVKSSIKGRKAAATKPAAKTLPPPKPSLLHLGGGSRSGLSDFDSKHMTGIKVNPFEYCTFPRNPDYRLKFVNNNGAVIEGIGTRRLVQWAGKEFWLILPWMYYFFRPHQECYDHFGIVSIGCSWKKVQSVEDPLFVLPLPNMYNSRPCYYPAKIYHPSDKRRYLYDPRRKDYPTFEQVVLGNLLAFWEAKGKSDGCHTHNQPNLFYSKLTQEWSNLNPEERAAFLKKYDHPKAGYEDPFGSFLVMWESKRRLELAKYNFASAGTIASNMGMTQDSKIFFTNS